MLEGPESFNTYFENNGGGSSVADDANSEAYDLGMDDGGEHGGVHGAAPIQDAIPHPHFGNEQGPWISSSTIFGPNGEKPYQMVVIEMANEMFEHNGGELKIDSILNVESNEMATSSDQHREAMCILLNMLLGATVGGSMDNGTSDEADDPTDKKDKVYEYGFKDPSNPDPHSHPCYTVHIEEVPDQETGEPFKLRLWYMVWDPNFTVSRSIISQMMKNSTDFKEAHTGNSKKKMEARVKLSKSNEHVKTRMHSVTNGSDLWNELTKYFGDRSAKIANMQSEEYAAKMYATAPLHPCALEDILNPRCPMHGPTVLAATPKPANVTIHNQQSDPARYFNADTGAFMPPQYVRDNNLFHTLHRNFSGKRDVRKLPLPTRGTLTQGRALLINKFASVFLKEHPDLSLRQKTRCFEAYMVGKDYDPANTMRSREQSAAWNTSKYEFSSNKYGKYVIKDGVRLEVNALTDLRQQHNRLDQLLGEALANSTPEKMEEMHAAARDMILQNTKMILEQRKEQIPPGTKNMWEKGIALMNRRKTPMSITHGKQHMKNKSMFGGFMERYVDFVRNQLKAQDPTLMVLLMINSIVCAAGLPGFNVHVFGPAGVGKSTLMHLFEMISLDGMNVQSQIQSLRARLRNDPYNGYHEWLDEASQMFEGLKITNKTPDQLDQANAYKRKVTEGVTSHAIPEEKMSDDGTKILQDLQLITEHCQSVTMNSNGDMVFGVWNPDDHVRAVLRRLLNYGALVPFEDDRYVFNSKLSADMQKACEDIKKNEFLTRMLLVLGQVSSEFEVEYAAADEIFRRMDLADGRPPMESGNMGHRRTLFKVLSAWNAVHCVFDCDNYHDQPEIRKVLFHTDKDGNPKIKPWSIEMMTVCIPFLKTPDESIMNYTWHLHDIVCMGRGPIVDQTMSLLVNESGFKMGDYKTNAKFMETFAKRSSMPFTLQDLETLYTPATIKTVMEEVQKAVDPLQSSNIDSMNKNETNASGHGNFLRQKVHGNDNMKINWNYMQTNVSTEKELAKLLFDSSNEKVGLTEEVIRGAIHWLKEHVNDYVGLEMRGDVVVGSTQFCYNLPSKPAAQVAMDVDTTDMEAEEEAEEEAEKKAEKNIKYTEEELRTAIEDYNQFPAMRAVSSGRSTETARIIKSYRGATNDKRPRIDSDKTDTNTSTSSADFGLCVQTQTLRDHAMRDLYAKHYASTHPQLKTTNNFLHRHGLARAKLVADKVFDMSEDQEMVTPYFYKMTLSPLYVKTNNECDHSVWTTRVKNRVHSTLSAAKMYTIFGVRPEVSNVTGQSEPVYDKLKTSELWQYHASKTLKRFGWSIDAWLKVVNDARTNNRTHRTDPEAEQVGNIGSSASSSASQDSPIILSPIANLE